MPKVDPSAKVHPNAELADDVAVGPFAVIDEHVRIGAGTVIGAHSVVTGHTELGRNNRVLNHVSLGTPPQDLSYKGEPTRLLIGDANTFREFVTVNTGTVKGGAVTLIGNQCLFMACSHVAHDCCVGDRVIMANCSLLAGHVKVENGCVLSGLTAVHHFVTLGAASMLGGMTGATHDVPPFMMMLVDHRSPRAVNVVGMKRNGYSDAEIESVQRAFRLLYRSKHSRAEVRQLLQDKGLITRATTQLLDFVDRSELGKLGRYLECTRIERGARA
jgi:UDP-N-acetylglucosamine acyltransferase